MAARCRMRPSIVPGGFMIQGFPAAYASQPCRMRSSRKVLSALLYSHLPHLSGVRFRAAASCQARARLPLRFFDLLLERFGSAAQRPALDEGRWHGHRTFLVDGSGCSIPDTPA